MGSRQHGARVRRWTCVAQGACRRTMVVAVCCIGALSVVCGTALLSPSLLPAEAMIAWGRGRINDPEMNGGWRFSRRVIEHSMNQSSAKILSLQHPTVVLFKNFLSLKETEQLVERARRGMSRSQIVGVDKDSLLAQDRTSYGAWLSGHEASRVEKRIQDVVGVPREFGESIYVLRYQESQKYVPHYDNCGKQGEALSERCWRFVSRAGGPQCGEGFGGATCGDRLATFIMYLRSPERGGQTVFPLARSRGDQHESTSIQNKNMDKDSWWCSGDDILMISPEPGDAVLFWDYIPKPGVEDPHMYKRRGSLKNGTMDTEAVADEAAYHGGCPVMEGEKWIATKWMRSAQYF